MGGGGGGAGSTTHLASTGRLLLQVHDELVFEVDEADAADAVRAIRPMMARAGEAFGLRVPTPARVCVGPDWGSLEEVFY